MDTGLHGHPTNCGQNLMYGQIFVHLPPHTWTNLSCVDDRHQKMYHGTKLPFLMWTLACYFWGCYASFDQLGLR